MRRLTGAVVVALALSAAVGCDSGSASHACDLLTRSEAEEVLGTPTRPATEDDDSDGPGTNCDWISEDSTTEPQAPVYGVSINESTEEESRAEFEETRGEESDIFVIRPVKGLGDEAYFLEYTEINQVTGTPALPSLHVRVGDRILDILIYDSDERPVDIDEAKALQRATAELVVRRLGGSSS